MHFTYLHSFSQPNNKLQKEALKILEAESNRLIDQPEKFIEDLKSQILELNAANPRCRALTVYTWDEDRAGSLSIGISLGSYYTVNFRLHRVKAAAREVAA